MMRLLAAVAALAMNCAPALASGSLSCSAADKALKLEIEGIFSQGLGEQLSSLSGTAEVRIGGVPETLRKVEIERSHAVQYWLYGREFRLRLYIEKTAGDATSTLDIAITTSTKSKDGTDFPGSYALEATHFDPKAGTEAKTWKASGKAACSIG